MEIDGNGTAILPMYLMTDYFKQTIQHTWMELWEILKRAENIQSENKLAIVFTVYIF